MSRYLDSSALVKLAVLESESGDLSAYLVASPAALWTSRIAVTEVLLAVRRRFPKADAPIDVSEPTELRLPGFTARVADVPPHVAVDAALIGADLGLRALDAIHVATALALRPGLTEVVTYDARMASACRTLGLAVVAPGDGPHAAK